MQIKADFERAPAVSADTATSSCAPDGDKRIPELDSGILKLLAPAAFTSCGFRCLGLVSTGEDNVNFSSLSAYSPFWDGTRMKSSSAFVLIHAVLAGSWLIHIFSPSVSGKLVLVKPRSSNCRDCIIVQIQHDQHVLPCGFRTPLRKSNLRSYLRSSTASGLWWLRSVSG